MKSGIIREYSTSMGVAIRTADIFAVIITALLAFYVRFHKITVPDSYLMIVLLAGMAVPLLFPMFGIYTSWRTRSLLAPTARILSVWVLLFVLIAIALVLVHQAERYSRLWVGIWFVSGAILLTGSRVVLYGMLRIIRRKGWNTRRVAIVGCGPLAQRLVTTVKSADWMGLVVTGLFYHDCCPELQEIPQYDLETLKTWANDGLVEEVWIALSAKESDTIHEVITALNKTCVTVRYAPDYFELFLLNYGITDIAGLPMINLTACQPQGVNRVLKELEDKILAAVILAMISPLMMVIALGVKLTSRGPIFYKQERIGLNGRSFMMLKFRSMVVDAESQNGAVWAVKNDERTTRIGTFLRRMSLDELPQFINVLKGNMSIVGPRPERPVFIAKFKDEIPHYMQKHLVKAGITGWAQVNGWRGQTDLKKRIEHDLYYIENWSLWFDVKIIFLTLFRGFVNKNAY